MHDIRAVRADPAAFDAALARRGVIPHVGLILEPDEARRAAQTRVQELQARRNQISRDIGRARAAGEAPDGRLVGESSRIDYEIGELESTAAEAAGMQLTFLKQLPNTLAPDVPDGTDESANVVKITHGTPPTFAFPARQHFELGEALGLMDFPAAAKLAGARFTILRGPLARLERALGQYMLDLHTTEHGYTEIAPPLLVNRAALFGTGNLPKFEDDLFQTTDGRFLIPTAETPLTNLVANDLLAHAALPIRVTALTPCFRAEAGSAGRDTRGMLRQHQFNKLELVSITRPERSVAEHARMTRCAQRVLTKLGLHWRRVLLCAGDTGFSAAKTWDLEVWLPGQQAWREISSCSNCRDFQARRMNARYRPEGQKGTAFVHTLNGSGVAVGRALIAVMETYQQADGSIGIPEVLRPRMGGLDRIGR